MIVQENWLQDSLRPSTPRAKKRGNWRNRLPNSSNTRQEELRYSKVTEASGNDMYDYYALPNYDVFY